MQTPRKALAINNIARWRGNLGQLDQRGALIIETDSYAGNFEREMAAYITGEIGDCEVGDDYAAIAKAECDPEWLEWWEDNVSQWTDEHGVGRPATIWPEAGYTGFGHPRYHSVAIALDEMPDNPQEFLDVVVARAVAFSQLKRPFGEPIRILGVSLQELIETMHSGSLIYNLRTWDRDLTLEEKGIPCTTLDYDMWANYESSSVTLQGLLNNEHRVELLQLLGSGPNNNHKDPKGGFNISHTTLKPAKPRHDLNPDISRERHWISSYREGYCNKSCRKITDFLQELRDLSNKAP